MIDPLDGSSTMAASSEEDQRSRSLSTVRGMPAARAVGQRYEIREIISQGGMGAVHRAWDSVLDRPVAVKVLLHATHAAARSRFEYEARITGQLQHPNIPPIYDLGTLPDGVPFLAMKLIEGHTLSDLLKSGEPGSARWLATFESICQAVGYAHRQNLIHRDLKPLNVMVGEFGEVQVMDWGLAKKLVEQTPGDPSIATPLPASTGPFTTDTALLSFSPTGTLFQQAGPGRGTDENDDSTKTGSVMGTPSYMSPEQARGEIAAVGRRSDVFSLGAILCELLTGSPPLRGPSMEVVAQSAAGRFEEALQRLDDSGEDPVLVSLAKRCLSATAADRPADASEVATAVARYRADADARAKDLERKQARDEVKRTEQGKRRRVLAWSATAVLIAMAVGLVASATSLKEARLQERIASDERIQAIDAKKRAQEAATLAHRETEAADEVSAFLVGLFEPRDKLVIAAANLQFRDRAGETLRARDLLARGVELLKAPEGLNKNPLTRARLLHEIAAIHFSLGESATARPLAEEAVAIRTAHLPENDPQLVKSLRLSAQLEYLEGDYAVCIARHRDAIARLQTFEGTGAKLDLAETEASLGLVYFEHDNAESAQFLKRAYETYRDQLGRADLRTLTAGWLLVVASYHGGDSAYSLLLSLDLANQLESLQSHPDLKEMVRLAMPLMNAYLAGKRVEEIRLTRQFVAQCEKVFGRDHFLSAVMRRRLADVLLNSGIPAPKGAKADHPRVDMQKLLKEIAAGRPVPPVPNQLHAVNEAARLYALNLAIGPKWDRSVNRMNLARTLERGGLYSEAMAQLHQALEEYRRQPPELSRDEIPVGLAILARNQSFLDANPEKLEPYYREAIRYARANPKHVSIERYAVALMDLGHTLGRLGRYGEADGVFAEVLALDGKKNEVPQMRFLLARASRVACLKKLDRSREADDLLPDLMKHEVRFKDSNGRDARWIRVLIASGEFTWP